MPILESRTGKNPSVSGRDRSAVKTLVLDLSFETDDPASVSYSIYKKTFDEPRLTKGVVFEISEDVLIFEFKLPKESPFEFVKIDQAPKTLWYEPATGSKISPITDQMRLSEDLKSFFITWDGQTENQVAWMLGATFYNIKTQKSGWINLTLLSSKVEDRTGIYPLCPPAACGEGQAMIEVQFREVGGTIKPHFENVFDYEQIQGVDVDPMFNLSDGVSCELIFQLQEDIVAFQACGEGDQKRVWTVLSNTNYEQIDPAQPNFCQGVLLLDQQTASIILQPLHPPAEQIVVFEWFVSSKLMGKHPKAFRFDPSVAHNPPENPNGVVQIQQKQ